MPGKIGVIRDRIRRGESVQKVVLESLETIENREGLGTLELCRTDAEIARADELQWQELSECMRKAGLEDGDIDFVKNLEEEACYQLGESTVAVMGRRRVFDLFAGTPPAAVTCIALAHLNDMAEEITGSAAADEYLRRLRTEFRKRPLAVQRALVESVSSRPVRAFLRRLPSEEVLRYAESVDDELRRGRYLPLAGITLAVKDLFAFGRTTAASRILADYVAPADYVATAIENLQNGGAVPVGKTNLDEFALGSSSESTAFWPAPRNPHDGARVAGGSSGGSAAAIGSEMVSAAIGSDTAGSIRVPASYCGCVGVKPTYGLVSRFGLFALSSSLDSVGPLASSVEDAAVLLGCMVGEDVDDRDQTQRRHPSRRSGRLIPPDQLFSQGLGDPRAVRSALQGITVGVPIEYFLDYDLDERAMASAMAESSANAGTLNFLELAARREDTHFTGTTIGAFFDWMHNSGHKGVDASSFDALWQEFRGSAEFGSHGVAPLDKLRRCPSYWERFPELLEWLKSEYGIESRLVSLPHTSLSIPAYFIISRFELASNLHRYDGLKYGRDGQEEMRGSYHFEAATRRMESLGTQPKQRILMGIHALQKSNHHTLLLRAQRARYLIRQDFLEVFHSGVDLLMAPTVNTVAPQFGGFSDTVAQQQMDQFSVPADHAGIPAISVPFYRTVDESMQLIFRDLARSLYQSVQVIGPEFEEKKMFQLAAAIERWESLHEARQA